MFKSLSFAAAALLFGLADAASLTLHDYPSLKDGRAKGNPPWCEVPYESLDLDRVTAYGKVTKDTCGQCLKVCGSVGCDFLLVIDQCTLRPDHVDISQGAGMRIVGSDTGNHEVKIDFVDARNCAGIWSGKMFFDYIEPYGGWAKLKALQGGSSPQPTSPAVVANPPPSSTPAPVAATPAQVKVEPVSSAPPVVNTPPPAPTTSSVAAPPPPPPPPVVSTSTPQPLVAPAAPTTTSTSSSSSSSTSTSSVVKLVANTDIRVFAEQTASGNIRETIVASSTFGTLYKPAATGSPANGALSNSTITSPSQPLQTTNAAGTLYPSLVKTAVAVAAGFFFCL